MPGALPPGGQSFSTKFASKPIRKAFAVAIRPILVLMLIAISVPGLTDAQSVLDAADAPAIPVAPSPVTAIAYEPPSDSLLLRVYMFNAIGPLPIIAAGAAAGLNQESNAPPEWGQGLKGYSQRFGSNLGIEAINVTSRFALAKAFHEDPLYYRCACRGFFPRLGHAVLSTVTARRGDDGHRAFSIPDLVSPYTGSMTAVYAWYPDRFGVKDAFRIGNYSMLAYVGGNIGLEFLVGGSHSLFSHLHLGGAHDGSDPGPNTPVQGQSQ
jgi:hypothetical protein